MKLPLLLRDEYKLKTDEHGKIVLDCAAPTENDLHALALMCEHLAEHLRGWVRAGMTREFRLAGGGFITPLGTAHDVLANARVIAENARRITERVHYVVPLAPHEKKSPTA